MEKKIMWITVIKSLLLTFAVYSLPMVIYRLTLKEPLDKGDARKMAIIYGVISFIIMTALLVFLGGSARTSGAGILWAWVNYKILSSGGDR